MSDPYRPPTARLRDSNIGRGVTNTLLSFLSALVLIPAIILAIGLLRGRNLPRFLFDPEFILAVTVVSSVSALLVRPSRKLHPIIPMLLSPLIGFGLLATFLLARQ
jgi:hypothetical protein